MKFSKKICYFLLKLFLNVALIITIIELYSLYKIRLPQLYPIFSMYELLQKPHQYFIIERDVALNGYLGFDKRIYPSKEDAQYRNVRISFPVRYEEFMKGCLGSYVTIGGKVKYFSGENEVIFYNFSAFSKIFANPIGKMNLPIDDFVKEFSYRTSKFNCNLR